MSSENIDEIWKDIVGYEDLYQVSNKGNVYSKRSKRILKGGENGRGYLNVILCKDGKRKTQKIHRLVAIHFIENPDDKAQVDHIDNNKQNNNISNLRWCSNLENQQNITKLKTKNGKACSSKYKGVYWHKRDNKWIAQICINGKTKHLGLFETEEQAYEVYKVKAQENHGEFFRE